MKGGIELFAGRKVGSMPLSLLYTGRSGSGGDRAVFPTSQTPDLRAKGPCWLETAWASPSGGSSGLGRPPGYTGWPRRGRPCRSVQAVQVMA